MRRGAAGLGPAVGSSRTGQKREPPLLSFFMGKSEIKYLRKNYEEKEREARKRAVAQRNQARKPSAILEEIEGMFGAPDFQIDNGDEE